MKNQNHSLDALLLSGIKVSTILINILSAAILSRMVSLEAYGTYSTGNLIVSTAASVTILGMMDASNYFYHQNQLNKKDCLNTIGFLQLIFGAVSAAVILLSGNLITAFFCNPMLKGIYIYIAFRPMLENLSNSLLSLQMAIRKARAVGIQNALFSISKLLAILLTVFVTKDIKTIFAAYLIMDATTVLYYYHNFKKAEFGINPIAFRKDYLLPVLRFAIPMWICVMTNSLARDIDKLVIGRFESTAQLAIYANCAAPLPFGIISNAFLTIIVPAMTRFVQSDKKEQAQRLYRDYLSVGFVTTSILVVTCMVLSEEAILLLYGEKYLTGKWVFLLYLIVDLIKFANTGLILSAKGQTKTLMEISVAMLVLNGILNVLLYRCMGVIGPAVATVVLTVATTAILLRQSCRIIGTSIGVLPDWKMLGRLCIALSLAAICGLAMRHVLAALEIHYFLRLICVGIAMCGGLLLLNLRRIKGLFQSLNQACKE